MAATADHRGPPADDPEATVDAAGDEEGGDAACRELRGGLAAGEQPTTMSTTAASGVERIRDDRGDASGDCPATT
jgi:hypothetical protein